jgi:predicted metal-dependent phosphoesterase TrpH
MGLCDPHVHTTFSDGRHTPAEVLERAAGVANLDVVAITDHDCIDGALEAVRFARSRALRTEVIVGAEVSSRDGHVVGLFLHEPVPRDMSAADTVLAIHDQGGLAIAVHPFRRPGAEGVAELATTLGFDAVELLNGSPTPRGRAANRRARTLVVRGKALTGGSDAHIKEMLGACCTAFPGTSPQEFREAVRTCRTRPLRRPVNLLPYLCHAARKVAGHPGAIRELWPV